MMKFRSSIPWEKTDLTPATPKAPWLKQTPNQTPTQSKKNHLETGLLGEVIAKNFLLRQGLVFIQANYRCKCGEIDLIMSQEETAIVVEVRVRNTKSHGSGLDSIRQKKQRRVSNCALLWWQKTGQFIFKGLRFDAVVLSENQQIDWIQNAWILENS